MEGEESVDQNLALTYDDGANVDSRAGLRPRDMIGVLHMYQPRISPKEMSVISGASLIHTLMLVRYGG